MYILFAVLLTIGGAWSLIEDHDDIKEIAIGIALILAGVGMLYFRYFAWKRRRKKRDRIIPFFIYIKSI